MSLTLFILFLIAEKLSIRSVFLGVLLVIGEESFLILLISRIYLGLDLVSKLLSERKFLKDIRMTESDISHKSRIELGNILCSKEVEFICSRAIKKNDFSGHR